MTSPDLLRAMVEALEAAGIPYMATGSFASSHHGRPRATQDFDLLIAPTTDQLKAFLGGLPRDRYYVDEQSALKALGAEDQFNVIEIDSSWKVDFIIRKSRPFSRTEFDRRMRASVGGLSFFIARAEDVLIAKLEWAKKGGSLRQIEDAAGILEVRGSDLDFEYVERWIDELGLQEQWAAARNPGH